ncbi:ANR family transcriptional regulator, partial [Providencia rettgeri]
MRLMTLFRSLIAVVTFEFINALGIITNTNKFRSISLEFKMARLTFIYCATMASQAERNGHYSQAHAHWIDASRLARKSENRV